MPEPEPVHPGVDLQVTAHAHAVFRGGRLQGSRGRRRRNGRRELVFDDALEIADAERTEHEDRGADTGLPQGDPLLDVGAGEHRGAFGLERQPDLRGAVAVGVRLDDGDDGRAAGGGAGGKET